MTLNDLEFDLAKILTKRSSAQPVRDRAIGQREWKQESATRNAAS